MLFCNTVQKTAIFCCVYIISFSIDIIAGIPNHYLHGFAVCVCFFENRGRSSATVIFGIFIDQILTSEYDSSR